MATFVRFENFTEDLAKGVHVFGTHVCKVYLSNTAPNAATHTIKANIAEIAGGNGYTAGGHNATVTLSRTGGVTSVIGVDITITASGGSIGPWQWAILYNDTPTSPADPLIGYVDRGAATTILDGDSAVIDFGANIFTLGA